jgi:hypothetical protein
MIVYYQQNDLRDFHILIKELVLYLQNNYNAVLKVVDNDAINIHGYDVYVADCDILIYFPELNIFKGMTFADKQNRLNNLFIDRNNPNDLILSSQYGNTDLYYSKQFGYKFKCSPSIYTPSFPNIDYDQYYTKRQNTTEYIDKFIFRGNFQAADRRSASILKNYKYFEGPEAIDPYLYFNELTKYKVGLSIPGLGELCYRDIEYMAIGIPMMKFEYITQLNPPLIPNYHYISIPRIDTEKDKVFNGGVIGSERQGGDRYVTQYIKRFEEIKDNTEFLAFISKNAKEYYETYLHPSTRIQHILNLLEIN